MEILIPQNFTRHLKNKRATMAAIGPMSKNCVEATIEIANEIIASAKMANKNKK